MAPVGAGLGDGLGVGVAGVGGWGDGMVPEVVLQAFVMGFFSVGGPGFR